LLDTTVADLFQHSNCRLGPTNLVEERGQACKGASPQPSRRATPPALPECERLETPAPLATNRHQRASAWLGHRDFRDEVRSIM
jgi:hypothetical protein